ncbi:hypothetical protein BZG36_03424 [Bifiguratus adelaidae]|uniref:HTH APSES-type domain-containing protein n=1 Tax=Bifiguratus adelaidae TaxID=1938954 RepID=A0A261XYR9_9FUNG|nr:hypothetical protein BZG36_03424 [Bifiguratus adelaidae]
MPVTARYAGSLRSQHHEPAYHRDYVTTGYARHRRQRSSEQRDDSKHKQKMPTPSANIPPVIVNPKNLPPLPPHVHSDDARDKVFSAILRALMQMDNIPASPRQLAIAIMQHGFATLGGATPFATVSSRISQHFKRAAAHSRPPILVKHVNDAHARKIQYSIMSEAEYQKLSCLKRPSPGVKMEDPVPTKRPKCNSTQIKRGDQSDQSYGISTRSHARGDSIGDIDPTKQYHSSHYADLHRGHTHAKFKPDGMVHRSRRELSPASSPSSISSADSDIDLLNDATLSPPTSHLSREPSYTSDNDAALSDLEYPSEEEVDIDVISGTMSLKTDGDSSSEDERELSVNCIDDYDGEDEDDMDILEGPDFMPAGDDVGTVRSPFHKAKDTVSAPSSPIPTKSALPDRKMSTFGLPFSLTTDQELLPNVFPNVFEQDRNETALEGPEPSSKPYVTRKRSVSDPSLARSQISALDLGPASTKAPRAPPMSTPVSPRSMLNGPSKLSQNYDLFWGRMDAKQSYLLARIEDQSEEDELASAGGDLGVLFDSMTQDTSDDAGVCSPDTMVTSVELETDFVCVDSSRSSSQPHMQEQEPAELADLLIENAIAEVDESKFIKLEEGDMSLDQKYPASALNDNQNGGPAMVATLAQAADEVKPEGDRSSIINLANQIIANLSTCLGPDNQVVASLMQSVRSGNLSSVISALTEAGVHKSKEALESTREDIKSSLGILALGATTNSSCASPKALSQALALSSDIVPLMTIAPTVPDICLTIVDKVPVFLATLSPSNGFPTQLRLMRRLDTNYVHATTLLAAGGIESESERSIVLSLEVGRQKVRKPDSPLCGTWIPLHRAQALASTCSMNHKLGPFLSPDLLPKWFPSDLPEEYALATSTNAITPVEGMVTVCPYQLQTPLTSPTSTDYFASHPLARDDPGVSCMETVQLAGHKMARSGLRGDFALKAPVWGTFGCLKDGDKVVDNENASKKVMLVCTAASSPIGYPGGASESDSDLDELSEGLQGVDIDTDTDEEVEEVRERMRRARQGAMLAIDRRESVDIDEIMRKAKTRVCAKKGKPHSKPWSHRKTETRSHHSHRQPRYHHAISDNDDVKETDEERLVMRKKTDGGKLAHTGSAEPVYHNTRQRGSLAATPRSTGGKSAPIHRLRGPSAAVKIDVPHSKTISAPSSDQSAIEVDDDEDIDIGGSDMEDDLR